jgi:SAM-dependent methyltransferase
VTPPEWTRPLPDVTVSDDAGRPIDHTIAGGDEMYDRAALPGDAIWHYVRVGQSALRCARLGLAAAGRAAADVRRVLDLPCGHGRVLRALAAAFPAAELHACDLNRDGVEFCARHFGAKPFYADPDPRNTTLAGPYDLIWVGSLMTHLDEARWPAFLAFFRDQLAPGGVCVLTTHGRRAVELVRTGHTGYGLADPGRLLADYDRTGFGYAPYAGGAGYGVSLTSPAWVCRQLAAVPGVRLAVYLEHGWAGHQDAVAWARAEP